MIVLRLFVVLYIVFFKSHFVIMSVFLLFNFFTKKTFRAGVKHAKHQSIHHYPPSTPPNTFFKLIFSTILFYGPPKKYVLFTFITKIFSLNKLVVFIENNRKREVYLSIYGETKLT